MAAKITLIYYGVRKTNITYIPVGYNYFNYFMACIVKTELCPVVLTTVEWQRTLDPGFLCRSLFCMCV